MAVALVHRRLAEIPQYPRKRQHHGGLAGAADMIVADAEYGYSGIESLALQAMTGDCAIDRGERRQEVRHP